jgi:hypothetical protein
MSPPPATGSIAKLDPAFQHKSHVISKNIHHPTIPVVTDSGGHWSSGSSLLAAPGRSSAAAFNSEAAAATLNSAEPNAAVAADAVDAAAEDAAAVAAGNAVTDADEGDADDSNDGDGSDDSNEPPAKQLSKPLQTPHTVHRKRPQSPSPVIGETAGAQDSNNASGRQEFETESVDGGVRRRTHLRTGSEETTQAGDSSSSPPPSDGDLAGIGSGSDPGESNPSSRTLIAVETPASACLLTPVQHEPPARPPLPPTRTPQHPGLILPASTNGVSTVHLGVTTTRSVARSAADTLCRPSQTVADLALRCDNTVHQCATLRVTLWAVDVNLKVTSAIGPKVMLEYAGVPTLGSGVVENGKGSSVENQRTLRDLYGLARKGQRIERMLRGREGERYLQILQPLRRRGALEIVGVSGMLVELLGENVSFL